MTQPTFRCKRRCFILYLLICLKIPLTLISAKPIPGYPAEQESVSDDFLENPMEHALKATAVEQPDNALKPQSKENLKDEYIKATDDKREGNDVDKEMNKADDDKFQSLVEGPKSDVFQSIREGVIQNPKVEFAHSTKGHRINSETKKLTKQGEHTSGNLVESLEKRPTRISEDAFIQNPGRRVFLTPESFAQSPGSERTDINRKVHESVTESDIPNTDNIVHSHLESLIQNPEGDISASSEMNKTIEQDKIISEFKELHNLDREEGVEETLDEDPNETPRELKLSRHRLSLRKIKMGFEHLKKGDLPALNSKLEMYAWQRRKQLAKENNIQTQRPTISETDRNKADKTIKPNAERSRESDKNYHPKQNGKRVRLQNALKKLREEHEDLKKETNSDTYTPPGQTVDQQMRKIVFNKLKLLKRTSGAFELSVNHGFDVSPEQSNHVSFTTFRNVMHNDLMSHNSLLSYNDMLSHNDLLVAAIVSANSRVKRALFRQDLPLRREVANIQIKPFKEIGHSESEIFFGAKPPHVWTEVPSHYSYLGLIDTPEKFQKTIEVDSRIMSHYNKNVAQELNYDMSEGDLVRVVEGNIPVDTNGPVETSEEEAKYEADGQDMKRVDVDRNDYRRRNSRRGNEE